MTSAADVTVALALREPRALLGASIPQWELLIRQARGTNLLARLGEALDELGLMPEVPAAPRVHLDRGAIARACASYCGAPRSPVYRTGARRDRCSYRPAEGRSVPARRPSDRAWPHILGYRHSRTRRALAEVEAALMLQGWATDKTAPYDQRYYRHWMHELPPMRHVSAADGARRAPRDPARDGAPEARFDQIARGVTAARRRAATSRSRARRHGPAQRHASFLQRGRRQRTCATWSTSTVSSGVLEQEPGFWSDLTARAAEMDLTRPLYYALRYLPPILDTPIPAQTLRDAEIGRPPRMLRGLMDRIFLGTLQPDRSGPADGWASLARGSIYVRAHWLRMPPLLLARHLTIKALRREEEKPE